MKKIYRILILIILILVILLIFAHHKETIEENENITNVVEENSDNTVLENNTTDTELSTDSVETEEKASFGELDVPVYKKGEKDIKLPVLIYHAFQTPPPEDDEYKLFSTAERFNENVVALINDGYTFITLEDIYLYNEGKIGLPEKNITITMDDGWVGCYYEAYSVLQTYNIPATIFIVENLVGTEGYFNWDQAKEMYDSGLVKIHVHGRKHINATDYSSKEDLINDYNHAHEMIEEKLGAKVQKIMAYPAGKSNENTINWLKEAGFEVQVQTKYGTVNKSESLDLTDIGRIRGEQATGNSILSAINRK
jgi:peptidoglycan/xylan/chitin deacetylase (PgdA/CDA1 family)